MPWVQVPIQSKGVEKRSGKLNISFLLSFGLVTKERGKSVSGNEIISSQVNLSSLVGLSSTVGGAGEA